MAPHHHLSPPPRLGVHEDLEAALDDEEEIDAQPHRQRDVQVSMVRVELNLHTTPNLPRIITNHE